MDGVILLRQARFAGLHVTADGATLVIEGPRRLEPMAQTLLAAKPQVMRALAEEQEVAWRIDAMRPQVPSTGGIPLLLARPGVRPRVGSCCSCGDPLGDEDRYRCVSCVAAAIAVLGVAR